MSVFIFQRMHKTSHFVKLYASVFFGIFLLGSTPSIFGAIAFDSTADCGNNGGTGTLTCTFNNSAGNIMFIGVLGDVTSGADDVQVPTYNSVSATFVAKITSNFESRFQYLYVLVSPATGSHTLSITSTTNHFIIAGVVTYSGAATSGQPDANTTHDTTGGSTTTLTSSLTTANDNDWVVLFHQSSGQAAGPTAGAGATRRTFDAAFFTWGFFDSNAAVHPAGSYSMTTNVGSASTIGHVLASFKPNSGAAAKPQLLTLMGVGR